MSWSFGQTSRKYLYTCEPKLQEVARRALELSPYDFGITCGVRTMAEQKAAVAAGASTTLHSRHLANENGLSEALDFAVYVGGKLTWEERYYRKVVQAFFSAAIELGVQIESGILWETFIDGPHIQLKRG